MAVHESHRSAVAAGRIPIPGTSREPWREFVLSIVTLGIYAFVHHYRVNRELRDFGVEVDPAMSLLAVTLGSVFVVPFLVWLWRTGERIRTAQETSDVTATAIPLSSVLSVLMLFLNVPYHQAQLNRVWQAAETSDPGGLR